MSETPRKSSDKAEELLPAAPREGLGAPVGKPPLLAFACLVLDGGKDGRVERLLQVLLRERRALDVVRGPDLIRHAPRPGALHRLDVAPVQVDEDVHVQQQVRLRPDQDDGRGRVVSPDLGDPLGHDVAEWGGVDHAEAQEEDVCVGVGQSAELVELFLCGAGKTDQMLVWMLLGLQQLIH